MEWHGALESLGGADPLGSPQWVPRGGRFVHPVGPGSGFLGMDGWGQQSHDRQIGFQWVPQDGHHAYPVGPSSGYPNRQVGFHGTPQEGHHAYPLGPSSGYTNRQVEFPQWAPQDWHPAYPVGPGNGHSGMQGWGHEFQGVSRQRARPYERPGTGGMGLVHHGRGVQRGPYYSGGPRVGPNYVNRGGSGGDRWDPVGSLVVVVAPLRLVPRGHRVQGCQGGSGGALRGGREPSVVSGRG